MSDSIGHISLKEAALGTSGLFTEIAPCSNSLLPGTILNINTFILRHHQIYTFSLTQQKKMSQEGDLGEGRHEKLSLGHGFQLILEVLNDQINKFLRAIISCTCI